MDELGNPAAGDVVAGTGASPAAGAAQGIAATRLSVFQYRSYRDFELELDPGVTVLVGRNAAGKTNLVEALQLLTAGASFRKPAPAELVHEGCDRAALSLELAGEGRVLDMELVVEAGKRSFRRNGKRASAAEMRGVLPSVLFCPDDLDLCKRSASVRRGELDGFGCQLNASYAGLVGAYERTVKQRNNLLRETDGPVDSGVLAAWDESLATTGAALVQHRVALVGRLRERFREAAAAIAPDEQADMVYESTLAGPDGTLPTARAELVERFLEELERHRAEEVRRCLTLVGPHRDEVLLTIDGRPARAYGSQGQQRSLVLAWKIAEVRVTRDILGRYPLLLLDDVMSELDARRREAIMTFIEGEIQTVITTTNLGYFSDAVLGAAKVVRIGGTAE